MIGLFINHWECNALAFTVIITLDLMNGPITARWIMRNRRRRMTTTVTNRMINSFLSLHCGLGRKMGLTRFRFAPVYFHHRRDPKILHNAYIPHIFSPRLCLF